jgi:hypothetical protein
MSVPAEDPAEAYNEAALLSAVALLATLATAADVGEGVRERRAGRDPSAQEAAEVVRPLLRANAGDVRAILMRLRASVVYAQHAGEDGLTATVRRFGDLMLLLRAARLLHRMHQRLLSLYPAVPEALAEAARRVHREAEAAREAERAAFPDAVGRFVEHALAFIQALESTLGPPPGSSFGPAV